MKMIGWRLRVESEDEEVKGKNEDEEVYNRHGIIIKVRTGVDMGLGGFMNPRRTFSNL